MRLQAQMFLLLISLCGIQSEQANAGDFATALGQCAAASKGPKALLHDQQCSGTALKICGDFAFGLAEKCREELVVHMRSEAEAILQALPPDLPELKHTVIYVEQRAYLEGLSEKKSCIANMPKSLCQTLLAEGFWLNARSIARDLAIPGHEAD